MNPVVTNAKICTLPETSVAPEKMASQKETSLPTINFQGYVSFREGTYTDTRIRVHFSEIQI